MAERKRLLLASAGAILTILAMEDSDDEEEPALKRSCWVDELNLTREREGMFARMNGMLRNNPTNNYTRMTAENFDYLVHLVTPYIQKEDTNYRKSISPAERLAVTLRYLASGSSMTSLSYEFRLSKTSVSRIVPETCEAIYNTMKDTYLKVIYEKKNIIFIYLFLATFSFIKFI